MAESSMYPGEPTHWHRGLMCLPLSSKNYTDWHVCSPLRSLKPKVTYGGI